MGGGASGLCVNIIVAARLSVPVRVLARTVFGCACEACEVLLIFETPLINSGDSMGPGIFSDVNT